MLHAPDFLGYESAIHMAADHADVVKKALELKKVGNDLVILVGGREIHPINVKVGGFYRVPTRQGDGAPRGAAEARARPLARGGALRRLARVPRLRAGLRVRLAAPPRRVPVQRGPDRVEQGARHPGLGVRGALHRGARRPRERPALRPQGARGLPRGPARPLQPELRPAAPGGAGGGPRRGPRHDLPQPLQEHRGPRGRAGLRLPRGAADHRRAGSRRTVPPWT